MLSRSYSFAFRDMTHRELNGFATDAYFDKISSSGLGTSHDKELEEEIGKLSVSELRERAIASRVDPAKLEEALNQLNPCEDHDRANVPADRGPLKLLILNTEGSSHRKALVRLQEMSVSKS